MSTTGHFSSRARFSGTSRSSSRTRASGNGLVASGVPPWATTLTPTGFALQSAVVGSTPETITIYAPFTETSITVTRAEVHARRPDESEEHQQDDAGISRWSAGDNSIQFTLIGLNPGEGWVARLTLHYSDLTTSYQIYAGLSTKAAPSLPATATLTRSRYVKAGGNDLLDGTTYANAWATWDKGILSTPTGGVLEVDDGVYSSSATSLAGERGAAITIVPRTPFIGDNGAIINSNRVLVEPPTRSSPTGSGHPNPDAWTLETVTGPGRYGNSARTYQLYRWESSGFTGTGLAGVGSTGTYRTNRTDDAQRFHNFYRDADYLSTPGGFAEYLYTNQYYAYGWWTDGAGTLWGRFPPAVEDVDPLHPGVDPNTLYTTFATTAQYGIYLKNGGASRISGIGFIGFNVNVECRTSDTIIDHCYSQVGWTGIWVKGTNNVVQHNRLRDTGNAKETPDHLTIAWGAVKLNGRTFNGTLYGNKISAGSESSAIGIQISRYAYIADNDLEGSFNGINGHGGPTATNRFYGVGTMITRNSVVYCGDDANEPEEGVLGWVIWKNLIAKSISGLSTGPLNGGPIYVGFNRYFRNSANYTGRRKDGVTVDVSGKVVFKFSSQSQPIADIYFAHNTVYADQVNSSGTRTPLGGDSAAGSIGGIKQHERFHWYGNIVITIGDIMDELNEVGHATGEWEEDYNWIFSYSPDTNDGIKLGGIVYNGTSSGKLLANYRTASGQGTHSNKVGATNYEFKGATSQTFFEGLLTDPTNGDLTPRVGSALLDVVPSSPFTARLGQANYNAGYVP